MIDWDQVYKDQGFKTESQMWRTLLVGLRNNEAVGKYLGVSRGAVQRRRQLLNLHKTSRRGATYRSAGKREVLDKVPNDAWQMPAEDLVLYIRDNFDTSISKSYIVRYRKQRGL
jgi:hypothetical protein